MKPIQNSIITGICMLMFLFFSINMVGQHRFLEFSGITWKVSNGLATPSGNNIFKDDTTMQYIDNNGWLHLKMKKFHGIWYCSQIQAQESFGYGEYLFYLKTNLNELDDRVVLGLLLDKDVSEANLPLASFNEKKIAIQISKWNDVTQPRGWYVIYPIAKDCTWPFKCIGSKDNVKSFNIRIPRSNRTTYKIIWNNSPSKGVDVSFQSYIGNSIALPKPGYLMHEVRFEGNNIPKFINEKPTLNLWFFGSNSPLLKSLNEVEVIIKSVSYSPVNKLKN